ncbi:uncharacterized protein LOC119730156 [Patiria miniata]|uniref:Uncharacterized protein n=1 Tax=Patiria miniata TaxID=46514 RepID=A0A914A568_PATMI|nr:uncharacterized protein LOC119730156 [Patiria miniata]
MWKTPSISVLLIFMTCVISFNSVDTAPLIEETVDVLSNPRLDKSLGPSSRRLVFDAPAISPSLPKPSRKHLQRSQKLYTSLFPSFAYESTPIQTPAAVADDPPTITPKVREFSFGTKQPFQSVFRQSEAFSFPPIPDLPPPPEGKGCRDRATVGERDELSGEGQLPVIPEFPEIPRWMPRSASHKAQFAFSSAERVYSGLEDGTSGSNQTKLQ